MSNFDAFAHSFTCPFLRIVSEPHRQLEALSSCNQAWQFSYGIVHRWKVPVCWLFGCVSHNSCTNSILAASVWNLRVPLKPPTGSWQEPLSWRKLKPQLCLLSQTQLCHHTFYTGIFCWLVMNNSVVCLAAAACVLHFRYFWSNVKKSLTCFYSVSVA